MLKLIGSERPHALLDMYNTCLREGVFPDAWKKQRLTLISKGKGDPESPAAYRPLCMLDTAGKLYERLLKPRLKTAVETGGGLSDRQHGFRPGRSTLGAIQDVVSTVERAQKGNHYSKSIVLLVTLDVRNAFNSVRWIDIIETLQTRYKIPKQLLKVVSSYLKDRELLYDTSDGPQK